MLRAFIAPELVDVAALRGHLLQKLPAYMVPSITALPILPRNVNDKVDHKSISMMQDTSLPKTPVATKRSDIAVATADSKVTLEHLDKHAESISRSEDPLFVQLSNIWHRILGVDNIEINSNFFDLGGNRFVAQEFVQSPILIISLFLSLFVLRLFQEIKSTWPETSISLVTLFHQSTLLQQISLLRASGLASIPSLLRTPEPAPVVTLPHKASSDLSLADSSSIAIVGIAGKFPGADNADEFYQLLVERRDGVTTFPQTDATSLLAVDDSIFVPRKGVLADVEDFDHEFWKLSKEEAADMDPQQRLFLDTAFAAMEDAGYVPTQQGRNNVGVFVGAAEATYHLITETSYGDSFARANRALVAPSISARVAYHLNLQGPNVTLNVHCASGMVALSLAVDNLNSGACDVALVGAVSIQFPQ